MSVDLIFVPTFYHWKALKAHWHEMQEMTVLTYDFSVGSLAQKYAQTIYLQSFLTETEISAHSDEALLLIKELAGLFSESFMHRGLDLASLTLTDHSKLFIALLNMRKALPRVFEELKIQKLYLFQELFKPDFSALPNTYYPDNLQGMLAWFAQRNAIPVHWIPGLAHTDDHSALIFHIISENSRSFTSGHIPLENHHFSAPLFDTQKFERTVFLVGYQMEIHDQEILFQALKQDPKTLLIFLCLQNTPMFEKTDSYLCLDFRYLKHWPFELGTLFQTIDDAKSHFLTMDTALHQRYPEIFSNAFLSFQFDFLFNSLKDNARTIEGMYCMSQAYPPDLVLGGGSATAMSAVGASLAFFTKHHFNTLGIMHGTLYDDYQLSYIPLPFKYFAVRGPEHIFQIEKSAQKRKEIPVCFTLGDLRMHAIQNKSQVHPNKHYLEQVFAKHSDQIPILLITSSTDNGMAQNSCDLQKHYDTWIKLRELALKRKDICFFVKNHPGYDLFGFYAEFCDENSPFVLLDRSIPITLILPFVKLSICVNTYTSAMIESASCQIPFIYLREAVYKKANLLTNSKLMQSPALLVECMDQLESCLDRFISDPAYKEQLLAASQKLADSFTQQSADLLGNAMAMLDAIYAKDNRQLRMPNLAQQGLISWLVQLAFSHLYWKETGNNSNFQQLIQSISHNSFAEQEKELIQAYLNLITHL